MDPPSLDQALSSFAADYDVRKTSEWAASHPVHVNSLKSTDEHISQLPFQHRGLNSSSQFTPPLGILLEAFIGFLTKTLQLSPARCHVHVVFVLP